MYKVLLSAIICYAMVHCAMCAEVAFPARESSPVRSSRLPYGVAPGSQQASQLTIKPTQLETVEGAMGATDPTKVYVVTDPAQIYTLPASVQRLEIRGLDFVGRGDYDISRFTKLHTLVINNCKLGEDPHFGFLTGMSSLGALAIIGSDLTVSGVGAVTHCLNQDAPVTTLDFSGNNLNPEDPYLRTILSNDSFKAIFGNLTIKF